jgi:hypothetical protein
MDTEKKAIFSDVSWTEDSCALEERQIEMAIAPKMRKRMGLNFLQLR